MFAGPGVAVGTVVSARKGEVGATCCANSTSLSCLSLLKRHAGSPLHDG